MVTQIISCYHCQSIHLVKHGRTRNDKQRDKWKDCGRSRREQPQAPGDSAEQREQILRAYQERSSLRGLTRTFGVARNTVSGWLKKALTLPPLCTTLRTPEAGQPTATILALDELWSFLLRRANQRWVWIALGRATRQVVGYALGDRSKQTCRALLAAIPAPCQTGQCY